MNYLEVWKRAIRILFELEFNETDTIQVLARQAV